MYVRVRLPASGTKHFLNLCSLIHPYTGTGWQTPRGPLMRCEDFVVPSVLAHYHLGQTKVKELSHKSESEVLLGKALLKP